MVLFVNSRYAKIVYRIECAFPSIAFRFELDKNEKSRLKGCFCTELGECAKETAS